MSSAAFCFVSAVCKHLHGTLILGPGLLRPISMIQLPINSSFVLQYEPGMKFFCRAVPTKFGAKLNNTKRTCMTQTLNFHLPNKGLLDIRRLLKHPCRFFWPLNPATITARMRKYEQGHSKNCSVWHLEL